MALGVTPTDESSGEDVSSVSGGVAEWSATPSPLHFAHAKARTTLLGATGVYARAGGPAADSGSGEIEATGTSDYWATFTVRSDTLAAGTPVDVRLDVTYDGSIEFDAPPGGIDGTAFSYASITGIVQASPTLGAESGLASPGILYAGDGGFYGSDFSASDDWKGDFAMTDVAAGVRRATLNVSEHVTFSVVVGGEYDLQATLSGEVHMERALGHSATVDFFDTATARLTPLGGGFDVAFVPEPLGSALALPAVALLRRRRRSAP